jgi:hypothetical protein
MSYRFIDYNAMSVKPDNTDVLAIYDIDADELKKITYATIKSLFIKVDEATDISANHEIQTGNYLYFGSSAESRISHDGSNFNISGLTSTGKLKLRVNSSDFVTLDPVTSSIIIAGNAINYDGTANEGIRFNSSNQLTILDTMQLDAGIACNARPISRTGGVGTGLTFDVSNNATFNQNLSVTGSIACTKTGADSVTLDGRLWCKDNIRMGAAYISYGGTSAGLCFDVSNNATFSNVLTSNGIYNNTSIYSVTDILSGSWIGGSYLRVFDGITAPGAGVGYARIYIDTADGDLKVIFPDGVIKTLATDS